MKRAISLALALVLAAMWTAPVRGIEPLVVGGPCAGDNTWVTVYEDTNLTGSNRTYCGDRPSFYEDQWEDGSWPPIDNNISSWSGHCNDSNHSAAFYEWPYGTQFGKMWQWGPQGGAYTTVLNVSVGGGGPGGAADAFSSVHVCRLEPNTTY